MDEEIIALILVGEHQAALHELASAYTTPLVRFCAGLLGSTAEAEELVQETYLQAWTAMPTFRAESTARAWLFGIARRLCMRHLKQRNHRTSLWQRWLGRQPESPKTTHTPDAEQCTILEQALTTLKPHLREAVLLRYQFDCDHNEIATILGIRPAAARKRTSLGIQALRDILDGQSFDDLPAQPLETTPAPQRETLPGIAGITQTPPNERRRLQHTPPSLPAFLPPSQIEDRLSAPPAALLDSIHTSPKES